MNLNLDIDAELRDLAAEAKAKQIEYTLRADILRELPAVPDVLANVDSDAAWVKYTLPRGDRAEEVLKLINAFRWIEPSVHVRCGVFDQVLPRELIDLLERSSDWQEVSPTERADVQVTLWGTWRVQTAEVVFYARLRTNQLVRVAVEWEQPPHCLFPSFDLSHDRQGNVTAARISWADAYVSPEGVPQIDWADGQVPRTSVRRTYLFTLEAFIKWVKEFPCV